MGQLSIETSRFGTVQTDEDLVITLVKPILGFENLRKFCLLEREESDPFMWLQSLDEPEVAFVVLNPTLFYPDYLVETHPRELEDIDCSDLSKIETYVIVTVAENPKNVTVNLQGPVLINIENRRAKQLVMVNSHYSVAQPLFTTDEKDISTRQVEVSRV
ncbi:MAG: flagellar assembly protein FliW [candidate division Zixibacteria bacterium]|nr:flagellar assembly protein FliW [candidate division Zixibacteria bacterium]